MSTYHLTAPLSEEDVTRLRIGDTVYLSGPCFTCRSKLQRYVFDEGHSLPFTPEEGSVLIHNGPIIVKENGEWVLKSFMPTSSIRFEKWGAQSIEQWHLRLICGKTTMGKQTSEAMRRFKCVHVSPRSVSPLLWLRSIRVKGVDLYEEIGAIEAPWHFELSELGPFIVDMDCFGNNLFDSLDERIAENRRKVFAELGIDPDFSYTKLYDSRNSCEP